MSESVLRQSFQIAAADDTEMTKDLTIAPLGMRHLAAGPATTPMALSMLYRANLQLDGAGESVAGGKGYQGDEFFLVDEEEAVPLARGGFWARVVAVRRSGVEGTVGDEFERADFDQAVAAG